MKPALYLIYALVGYIIGLANIAYIVGFLADIGVPKGIGDGPQTPMSQATVIDAGLVLLFGLHHSVTARTAFKKQWTKIIPAPIERATYLYMTAFMSVILVVFWRPIPVTVWHVDYPWAGAIYSLYLLVWALMFSATFHFGHFSFFGVAQAWAEFRKSPPRQGGMTARFLYALVRHPISLGWMITPLIVPHLTVGHLVFAGATFVYIMAATPFEEADLIEELGDEYREYKKRTPAFVPRLGANKTDDGVVAAEGRKM
ncbi:methyltransferase family protein [Hyphococcus luteus]|uniref:Uncharacterized protein n=1 Tax=Hyphococcus luteus TaxID=2058213 RepID=A0A2S7K7C4_9PROT|nr:isoprenylcysteine carboxylmethyltransferase family protein [Marinicaulis flavus]PQA88381.1 hypothetical protein CW354_08775 [Marinicaulis flavus]